MLDASLRNIMTYIDPDETWIVFKIERSFAGARGTLIKSLDVPLVVRNGTGPVDLICIYEIDKYENGLVIKWFHEAYQIYQWIPPSNLHIYRPRFYYNLTMRNYINVSSFCICALLNLRVGDFATSETVTRYHKVLENYTNIAIMRKEEMSIEKVDAQGIFSPFLHNNK